MRYVTVEGKTRQEVTKKIHKKYGNKIYIIDFLTREIEKTVEPQGFLKRFKKPVKEIELIHFAYCGIPENDEELENLAQERNEKKIKAQNEANPPLEQTQLQAAQHTQTQVAYNNSQMVNYQDNEQISQLSQELSDLKNIFRSYIESQAREEVSEENQEMKAITQNYMLEQDFSLKFTQKFLEKIHIPVNDLDTFKLILNEKIRNNIDIVNGFTDNNRFIMIMGPTGVGKTTTIAKLAAIYFFQKKKKVRFLSFDSYRLGADIQMKKYAEVFECPFHLIQSEDELKMTLKSIGPDEMVFMDTAGESVGQEIKLSEIEGLLKHLPEKPLKLLAINANSKSSDLMQIKEKFSRYSYDYYIITKLDETKTIGPIAETLYEAIRPVAYLTTGQEVPDHIKVPEMDDFLKFL